MWILLLHYSCPNHLIFFYICNMVTQEDVVRFLRSNMSIFRTKFHLQKIGIFGSFARNQQTDDSDIDIIIELESDVEDIRKLKSDLRGFIQQSFDKPIDIAREKYLHPYARNAILQEVIYVQ